MTDSAPTPLSDESLVGRARWAIIALGTVLLSNVLAVGGLLSQEALLMRARDGHSVTPEAANANDAFINAINGFHLIAFVVAGIVYLRWFHAAYARMTATRHTSSDKTASDATWDWFIPFVNFVRPYQNVSHLWLRTAQQPIENETGGSQTPPPLVGLWWLAYIGSSLASRAVDIYSNTHSTTIADLIAVTDLWLFVNLAQGVAAILAAKVVWQIKSQQAAGIQTLSEVREVASSGPEAGQPSI